ncbi:MAG: alpha/beta fold hydrolase [Gammaproteobacteria bacterium]|nr:alpha/beta fold hydrolase [Gammaproteobacteria bacterium]
MDWNQDAPPHPLPSEMFMLDGPAGALAVHVAGPEAAPPVLLVHSVNAAASAAEIRPLFESLRQGHRVYAPDLPGFGLSARPAIVHTPRVMTDALATVQAAIAERHPGRPLDALAVSLGCEFLARAASENPAAYRSLALVSPTGFRGARPPYGSAGSTRALPRLHAFLTRQLWRRRLFDLLTSRRSIRFFLRKTWGDKHIDEQMFEYAWRTARAPGAEHAPLCFLSGFLFSADIGRVYETLRMPVWMVHGTRGDFVDYRLKNVLALSSGWSFDVMQAGALPYFEQPQAFLTAWEQFRRSAKPLS